MTDKSPFLLGHEGSKAGTGYGETNNGREVREASSVELNWSATLGGPEDKRFLSIYSYVDAFSLHL